MKRVIETSQESGAASLSHRFPSRPVGTAGRRFGPPGIVADLLLLLLLTGAVGWPLLLPGFLVTDDGLEHVLRAWALGQRWAAGEIFPRWLPELGLGHGFPLFFAYAPGLYYPIAVLAPLLGGYLAATTWVTLALLFLLASGAYLAGRAWAGRIGGVLAAAASVAAPYVLLDALSRMSLPELAVLAAQPWLLLLLDRLVGAAGRRAWLWAALTGLLGAAIISTYTFGALLLLPAALTLVGAKLMATQNAPGWRVALARLAVAGAIALGLSAAFWLPAAAFQSALRTDIQASGETLDWNFQSPGDLLADWRAQIGAEWWARLHDNFTRPVAAPELPGILDRPMAPAPPAIAVAIIGLIAAWRRGRTARHLGIGLAAGAAIALLLTFGISRPIWDLSPALSYLQFPWRFFGPVAVSLGLLAAFVPGLLPRPVRPVVTAGLAVVLLLAGLGAVSFARYPIAESALSQATLHRRELLGHLGTTSGAGQFLPRWVSASPEELGQAPGPDESVRTTLNASYRVLSYHAADLAIDLRVEAAEASRVVLPGFFFPIWSVTLDGRPAAIAPTEPDGLLAIDVPAGVHDITVRRAATPAEVAGLVVSLATLGGLAVLFAWAAPRRRWVVAGMGTTAVVAVLLALTLPRTGTVTYTLVETLENAAGPQVAGYALDPSGDAAFLHVLWQARSASPNGAPPILALPGSANPVSPPVDRVPLDGAFPVTRWPAGLLLTDSYRIPPESRPFVEAALTDPAGLGAPIPSAPLVQGGRSDSEARPEPGPLVLTEAVVRQAGRTALLRTGNAPVEGDIAPGKTLTARLGWTPAGPITEDFRPALQLLGPDNQRVAEAAIDPLETLVFTSLWVPGEQALTEFSVQISPDAPPGRYRLAVSFFLPDPDRRIPVGFQNLPSEAALVVGEFTVSPTG